MNDKTIIEDYYKSAVKGIIENEKILENLFDWQNYCSDLSKKEFITYSISLLDWQINNGGFHQYFFNSYSIFCFQTIENLKEIKCDEHAEILKKAIEIVYGNSLNQKEFVRKIYEREIEKINSFKEAVFEEFRPLEKKYFLLQQKNEIFEKLVEYLRS
jgi:hypothetical protein